jgi:type VI protein secretion system component Hcp
VDTNSTIEILREASAEQLSALSDLELDGVSGGKVDAASPKLFTACCTGKHFANATVTVR